MMCRGKPLPGQGIVPMKKAAGGAIFGQGGEAYGSLRALSGGQIAAGVHGSSGGAGMAGVDFDSGSLELLGVEDGEHVQGRFAGAVDGHQRLYRKRSGGGCRQRPQLAGLVDDASCGRGLEQGQQSFNDEVGAENIGFVAFAKCFVGDASAFRHDTGIVDQNAAGALGGADDAG